MPRQSRAPEAPARKFNHVREHGIYEEGIVMRKGHPGSAWIVDRSFPDTDKVVLIQLDESGVQVQGSKTRRISAANVTAVVKSGQWVSTEAPEQDSGTDIELIRAQFSERGRLRNAAAYRELIG